MDERPCRMSGRITRTVCVAVILALGIAVFWYMTEPPSGDEPLELEPPESDLFNGVLQGNLELVRDAIDQGVDVNTRDMAGTTALQAAVLLGREDVVGLLVAEGADVNLVGGAGGRSPLHDAILSGDTGVVSLLIAGGANVNATDGSGKTPLERAAELGNEEAKALLLSRGAVLHDIIKASGLGQVDVVADILRSNPNLVNARGGYDEYETTPLHKAAYYGHKDVLELLLRSGAVVNAEDRNKATPLHEAVYAGHGDIVEVLLAHGADVNAPAWGHVGGVRRVSHEFDDTPLHLAARRGHTDIAALLLEHGADVTARNREGYKGLAMPTPGCGLTPLGVALKAGHTDVADLLRQHGGRE